MAETEGGEPRPTLARQLQHLDVEFRVYGRSNENRLLGTSHPVIWTSRASVG